MQHIEYVYWMGRMQRESESSKAVHLELKAAQAELFLCFENMPRLARLMVQILKA